MNEKLKGLHGPVLGYSFIEPVVEEDDEAITITDHAVAINELCIAEEKKSWKEITKGLFHFPI